MAEKARNLNQELHHLRAANKNLQTLTEIQARKIRALQQEIYLRNQATKEEDGASPRKRVRPVHELTITITEECSNDSMMEN